MLFFEIQVLTWSKDDPVELKPSIEIANLAGISNYCERSWMSTLFPLAFFIVFSTSLFMFTISKVESLSSHGNRIISIIARYSIIPTFLIGVPIIVYVGVGFMELLDVSLFSRYGSSSHIFTNLIEYPIFSKNISCEAI